MSHIPYHENADGEPLGYADLVGAQPVDGVVVASVQLEDGTNAVAFFFTRGRARMNPIVFMPETGNSFDELAELVTKACAKAKDHPRWETPPDDVTCPMCGRRIFGAIALRGFCLTCVPSVDTDPNEALDPDERLHDNQEGSA